MLESNVLDWRLFWQHFSLSQYFTIFLLFSQQCRQDNHQHINISDSAYEPYSINPLHPKVLSQVKVSLC